MKYKKEIIIVGVIILIVLMIFLFDKFQSTGNVTFEPGIKTVPLTALERDKVTQTLLASEFIKDVPKNNPIALKFFKFENGQRVWQDEIIVGKDQLLTSGKPSIYLALHSKYISQMNNNNLCDVIKKAKANGDVGFYSDYNKLSLFVKYTSMLEHRGCFGI